jgi:hypothetical protein
VIVPDSPSPARAGATLETPLADRTVAPRAKTAAPPAPAAAKPTRRRAP